MIADSESQTLLLVDDDQIFRDRLAQALRKRQHEVWTAGDAVQALQIAKLESPELAIVDLRMPDNLAWTWSGRCSISTRTRAIWF